VSLIQPKQQAYYLGIATAPLSNLRPRLPDPNPRQFTDCGQKLFWKVEEVPNADEKRKP